MNVLLLSFVIFFVVVPSAVHGSKCDVVPIQQWAGSASGYSRKLAQPVGLVVVTHTVTGGCFTDAECERIANSIRNSHKQLGHADLRLSFLVGGNGKIYEGSGWNVGEHSGSSVSEKSISLSFIGDFRNVLPSNAALKAAENFLGCFLNTRYLDCEYGLVGHRQVMATISPGDALQNLIQTWPHWIRDAQVSPN